MLSLSNVSAGMAFSYFSNDDYYAPKDNEVEITGRLSKDLGLKDRISKREFGNLLEGISPDGRISLAKPRTVSLPLEVVKQSLSRFESDLERAGLNSSQRGLLNKEIDAALGDQFATNIQKSLTIWQKRSLKTTAKICTKNWGLNEESKKIVEHSIASLLKVLAPETRRAATDMTFSAPKSLSILGLVGGKKEIIESHNKAVSFALQFIEKEYVGTRVTRGKKTEFQSTGNMLGARFIHGTSREGDPQIHTHCVIFNLTKRQDSQWAATGNDEIFRDSKLLGTIYQNKLAELVQELGYEIEPSGNGTFELKGYSKEQLNVFSKRRHQVLEEGAKILFQRQKEDGAALNKTFEEQKTELMKLVSQELTRTSVYHGRKAKQELTKQDLKKKWKGEAKMAGIRHPDKNYRSLWGGEIHIKPALKHISERKAVFKSKEIELEALVNNLGKASFEKIKTAVSNSIDYVLANSEKQLGAHIDQLRLERDVIRSIKNQRSDFKPLGTTEDADRVADRRGYTPDQRKALKLSFTSKDQFLLWNGVAGSGKSYALNDLRNIAENRGISVIALAPDGGSARELGKSIKAPSATVHRFLAKKSNPKKSLIIIDEATKLSTKLMIGVLQHAEKSRSRIVFAGDRRQFSSVEAGAPFEALHQRIAKVELTEHQRQAEGSEIKKAVEQASIQSMESLKASTKTLDARIVQRKSAQGRQAQFIKSYLSLTKEEREKTLLLVDLNHDRRNLTQALRIALQNEGEISKSEITLPILVSKNLSEVQKKRVNSYAIGDFLITHKHAAKMDPGLPYEVKSISEGKLKLQSGQHQIELAAMEFSGSVFRKESIQVAKGDTLEWRKNQGNQLNRDALTVTKTSRRSITVQDKTGQKIKIPTTLPQHIDYAHVKTAYSSQGATADRVLALSTSRISMQSWYVTLSRAKHGVKIITDSKEKLAKNILKSSKQQNAMDVSTRKDLEKYVRKMEESRVKSLQIPRQAFGRDCNVEA